MALRRLSAACVLSLLLVATSCGKDSTTPEESASFEGLVLAGAVKGTKSGPAYYEMMADGHDFSLFGFSSDDTMEFDIRRNSDWEGVPSVGTGTFGASNYEWSSTMYVGDVEYQSISGSLVITNSTPKAVKGSFNITYTNGTQNATFTGTFYAPKCPDC